MEEMDGAYSSEAAAAATPYMAMTYPQGTPEALYISSQEYAEPCSARRCPNTNFLKGIKWSPDGACCLTASDDNWLRVYDLPQDCLTASAPAPPCAAASAGASSAGPHGCGDSMQAALVVVEGETVYDYCWYSRMVATDPVSCCFATSSRAHPVHLWDASSGELRCSYRGHDDVDEVTAAFSLAFSPCGLKIYAGYNRCMKVFDIGRPGRDCQRVATHQKRKEGVPGIISCIAASGDQSQLAVGSYAGVVGVLDARTLELLYVLHGHKGGVTQVLFSSDGNFLFSGARQDSQLLCWDVRYTSQAVYTMQRDTATTNQRIHFDIEPCNRHLATGTQSGDVQVFDLQTGLQVDSFRASADVVNGCAFHPCLPLLATASGHRRYPFEPSDNSSGTDSDDEGATVGAAGRQPRALPGLSHKTPAPDSGAGPMNAMRMWRLQHEMRLVAAAAAADTGQDSMHTDVDGT